MSLLGNNDTNNKKRKCVILKHDITRRKWVIANGIRAIITYLMYVLIKNQIIKLNKAQQNIVHKTLETIALFGAIVSITCAIVLVFYVDKKNKEIGTLLTQYSSISLSKKTQYFLKDYANKTDLLGTCICSTVQIITALSVFFEFSINKYYKSISEIIGILCFFVCTVMMLGAFLLKQSTQNDFNLSNKKELLVTLGSCISVFLLFYGKILQHLNYSNSNDVNIKNPFNSEVILCIIGQTMFIFVLSCSLYLKTEELQQIKSELNNIQVEYYNENKEI